MFQCRSTPSTTIDTSYLDRHTHPPSLPTVLPSGVGRHRVSSVTPTAETSQTVKEHVYKPIPPYPHASKTYNALVQKISWQFPEVHEFRDLPCVKKIVDKAYAEEISLNDDVDLIYLECSTILHSRSPPLLPDSSTIPPSLRKLPKIGDPGKFVVPCSIIGVDFKDALCDSGSTVNVMSMDIARSLGITALKKTLISIQFADSSSKTTQGCIEHLDVRIGDCLMPTDFQVVEMCNGSYMPLILGRSFLATAGALVDLPNKRVCLSNINMSVFYEAIPENADRHGSYVAIEESFSVVDAEHLDDIAAGYVKLKDAKEEVMHVDGVDRHPPPVSFDTHQETAATPANKPNQQTRNKPESNRVNAGSHITLTPQRRVGDHIEYKVKCKGMSKPFSKVKALKAQGQAAVDAMMNRVLKLGLNPPPPLPYPSSDPHHL